MLMYVVYLTGGIYLRGFIFVCMYIYIGCTLNLIIAFEGRGPYSHIKERVLSCRTRTDFRIIECEELRALQSRRGM